MIQEIKEFNLTSGLVPRSDFSDKEFVRLKLGLIKEETKEIEEAIEANDKVELLDGILDLLYVTIGLAVSYGLDGVLEEGFQRVHDSNMSKFCSTKLEAIASVAAYKEKGIETHTKQVGSKWVIFRTEDGKVLKSIAYTPVNLEDLCSR